MGPSGGSMSTEVQSEVYATVTWRH
jgi:hypothetical protein